MRATDDQKAYMRGYYLRNREAIVAKARARREANPEKHRADRRKNWNSEVGKLSRVARIAREPLYYILSCAKSRARKKGLEFSITLADVPVPATCPVLGIPLKAGRGRSSPNSPSIDRISNDKGYVPGNVWVISYLANARKNDQSAKEILAFGVKLRLALAARGYVENDA